MINETKTQEVAQEITDEEIFRAWTGKKDEFYYKINNKKFNFCACFLGIYYLFYRRMYLVGAIAFLISYVIGILEIIMINAIGNGLAGFLVEFIIGIALAVAYGFAFYPVYKWNYRRKINKQKMYGYKNEELLRYAREKGGVSWTPIIILLLFPVLICLIMLMSGVGIIIFNSAMEVANEQSSTMNEISASNVFSNSTLTSNRIVLENNEYSINLDTTKWKETNSITKNFLVGNSAKKAFTYNNGKINVFAYTGSEYVDKNLVDFTNYNNLTTYKDMLYEEVEQMCKTRGAKLSGVYLYSKNNTYYIEANIQLDESASKIFMVFEKEKNKILGFALCEEGSYIDYSVNNEIVDAITKINVE